MKKLVAIVVILGLAGVANADFYDDFDTGWTQGDSIVGNNGWVDFYDEGAGTVDLYIGAAGTGIASTKGSICSSSRGGIARDITADKSGDSYTASVVMSGLDSDAGGRLHVGAAGHLTSATAQPDEYLIHATSTDVTIALRSGGGWNYHWWPNMSAWPYTAVDWSNWIASKIVIDTDYAHAFIAEVDGTTGALLGSWVDLGRFPNVGENSTASGPLTGPSTVFFTPAEAAVQHYNANTADNFASTPEPVTLSLLALGAGLVLLRRRR